MLAFKSKLPGQEGFLLCPELRKQIKTHVKKTGGQVHIRGSYIPTHAKRGGKEATATYRNRVGRKAQLLSIVCIYSRHTSQPEYHIMIMISTYNFK